MVMLSNAAPGTGEPLLSIGDLADRTGVSAATVRIWEARHGFPDARRLASGHRRYSAEDVAAVLEVARLRDSGVRLDAAISRVRASVPPAAPADGSVFALLRRLHPELHPLSWRKRTLIGMSWAIEDEFASGARPGHLFGAFQHREHYAVARSRWKDLSAQATASFVFADFDEVAGDAPVEVPIARDTPMAREWLVVCDSPGLSVVLTARELPGQDTVPDADRRFEALWTVDPGPVRTAARACARMALEAGAEQAFSSVGHLSPDVVGTSDLRALTSLVTRSISYVDGVRPR